MRIALVPTVSAPVRQDSSGSVEAWTWLLARELKRLGHGITIFGCAGSETDVEFIETLPGAYGANASYDDWQLCEWVNLCRAVEQSKRFDVLHAQAYLWGIPLQPLAQAPLLHTTHIVPDDNAAKLWAGSPGAHVTALSKHQWSAHPELKPAAIIPHGVDTGQFTFREQPDDYVLYLGRFTSGKGPLLAIKTARALGLRLILAGPENPYFRDQIKPLVGGKHVDYAGVVRGRERDRLLGGARALLYPIQYPESFGLVMVEAMLCGTPVAAMRLGAVPEIIEENISGISAMHIDDFAQAVTQCFALNRKVIRERAEKRFSAERMARDYANVYASICNPPSP
ncbi:MAG TPA: glycosyltransferase family 4 protein [Candidatus Angelobacter sp.]|nr:glycosyltransferase family 4 protein [Candidatus Angelobacter sp.]